MDKQDQNQKQNEANLVLEKKKERANKQHQ
jgi:hypothetical protein